jgi:DNA polymerase III gamma/tau subunit
LVTALAQGSIATAETLLANEDLATARQDFYQVLHKLATMRPAEIIGWCEQWDKNKKMVKALLELGQLWYHDSLLANTSRQWDLLVNQDYLAPLKTQKMEPQQLLTILQYFQTGLAQLESNASPRLVLEIALLKTQTLLTA